MIVYINTFFALSLHEKTAFLYEHLKWMPNFFQNKAYGTSVKEIAMSAVANTEDQLQYYGFGTSYSKRAKSIGILFKIDLDLARESTNAEILLHMETKICEEIEKLQELNPKNFDLKGFLLAMKDFFHIVKTTDSNSLSSKFEDYNDEVRSWQEEKVKRFLRSK